MTKLLAVFTVAALAPTALTGQALSQSDEAAIDEVFAAYDAADVPGAAVAVIRGGEIIYSKAFGSAQLEYGIPVEPTTPFHVASVSKQFTAMAVLLLVEEGRIDLDEDLRTYLDWVPELPAIVTPRHLLSHTSGIRDQWELLMTAGWRLDDVITKEHVRRLMTKQRQLNFRPGTRQMYSNMGFSLAAELVQEVSGQPFDEFVEVRILEPLGMERTHVHDDHQHMVPGRAYSYRPDGDGYANGVLSYANHGATSLFTTAEDLVVWLDNYRTGTVGGAMLDEMTARTVLADGDTISNALGLFIDEYRGRSRIQHGGADAGFRSFVAWFPQDEVGIAVVSNLAATNAGGLASGVADVVLESVLEPVEEDEPEQPEQPMTVPEDPAEVDPATLERYVGAYSTNMVNFSFEVRNGELWLTQPEEGRLVAESEVSFVTENGIARFEFEVEGSAVTALHFYQGTTRLEGAPMVASEPVDPDEYVGAYWSPEIETLYEIRRGDDGLLLYTLRHGEMPLVHREGDLFGGSQSFSRAVQFRRGPDGEVAGFTLSGGRVLNHRFLRVVQPMPGGGLPDA